jgi:toxin-antitoxin system PIN domain toxin
MLLVDVNVLVYAYRADATNHGSYREWLHSTLSAGTVLGLADPVLSGFLRITTHPRVFDPPSPLADAIHFVEALRSRSGCLRILPQEKHWEIFTRLCLESGATGNLVPDAYLAALAIESESEWITTDRDFGRFAGLRWRHPLTLSP